MPGSRPAAAILAALLWLAACGCQPSRYPRSAADAAMFGPQAVRIHPTFTRTKDWNGDGVPDGVEAVLELQDEFGEPTRATGRAMFEVYQYRPYTPDPRGKRNAQVWDWPLSTRQEQVEHWSRALRAYTFKIPFDPGRQTVVLAATFALDGGTPRLFDQIILEPSGRTSPTAAAADAAKKPPRPPRPRRPRPDRVPTTQPATTQQPTTTEHDITEPATAPETPDVPESGSGVDAGDSGVDSAAEPTDPPQSSE